MKSLETTGLIVQHPLEIYKETCMGNRKVVVSSGLCVSASALPNKEYSKSMTTIRCRDCNKNMSDEAWACPHCGYSLMKGRVLLFSFVVIVGVYVAIVSILGIDRLLETIPYLFGFVLIATFIFQRNPSNAAGKTRTKKVVAVKLLSAVVLSLIILLVTLFVIAVRSNWTFLAGTFYFGIFIFLLIGLWAWVSDGMPHKTNKSIRFMNIHCTLCNKKISDKVVNCPHCGMTISKGAKRAQLAVAIFSNLVVLTLGISLFFSITGIIGSSSYPDSTSILKILIIVFVGVVIYLSFKLWAKSDLTLLPLSWLLNVSPANPSRRQDIQNLLFVLLIMTLMYYGILRYHVQLWQLWGVILGIVYS